MKDKTWAGKRVYLAGGMTGIPERNYPLFDAVHAYLESEYEVDIVSPVVMNRRLFPGIENEPGHASGANDAIEQGRRHLVMRWDVEAVLNCDAIALLPDWELSPGATLERRVAEAVGKEVLLVEPFEGQHGDEFELVADHNQERMSATELPPLRSAFQRGEALRLALEEQREERSLGWLKPKATFTRKPVQFHCMPPEGLRQLGIVGGMGADKHGSNSYREGNPPQASYHVDAIFRHLIEYMEGVDSDAESGASPLAHVAWRALAIIQGHEDIGASFDDRWQR